MNWSHLRALLWIRWRIIANRGKRASNGSKVLFCIALVIALFGCLGLGVLATSVALEALPEAEPMHVMFAWGGLMMAFLFSWMIGLVTDLQKSDSMSLKNLLHLPVSLQWIFLYNYLSSFVCFSVAIFLPPMLGACIAMVWVDGPAMLLSVPLVFGFLGMITALTYQLRGWLAGMMEDKRKGRNIVAAITVGFVLLTQVPSLINMTAGSSSREEYRRERDARRELEGTAGEDGPDRERAAALLADMHAEEVAESLAFDRAVLLGTMIVPLGWMPYGMRSTFERRWLPGSLCVLGLFLITGWSLRRSYRATLVSIVSGGAAAASREPTAADLQPAVASGGSLLVQRSLPFVSERASGIAFTGLRSLLRAPEAKMLMLSPVLILGLCGVLIARSENLGMISSFAPTMGLGAIALGLLSIAQLLQNQFGLDREGFRAYVMSPVSRRDILLGKNLATAPLGMGAGLVALVGLQILIPTDLPHFVGSCLQLPSAYMLLCLVGNTISILGPMRLRETNMRAANPSVKTILWQILAVFLIPIVLTPLMIPGGVEFFLPDSGWTQVIPIYPAMHLIGLALIVVLYRWGLARQGELLQEREQRILELLTRA